MNSYAILFYGIMVLLFIAMCILDMKGTPFQIDKEYLSLKVLGILPAILFIGVLALNGTSFGKVSDTLGILYHLVIIWIIPRLKAPNWAKQCGYGWLTLDVACGIMSMCNVADEIAYPVRLGGHVLCAIWIINVCLFCKNKILKYLGFFIAAWLGVYSFFGGVLPLSYLMFPGILVIVWLVLMGFLYEPTENTAP